jgi:glycosyltransferase involved in cell wall biosynthesis
MLVYTAMGFYGKGAVSIGARQYTRALARAGHTVLALTDAGHARDTEDPDLAMPAGVTVVELPVPSVSGLRRVSREMGFAWASARYLEKRLDLSRVELLFTQISTSAWFTAPLLKRRGIPCAYIIQGLAWDIAAQPAGLRHLPARWMYLLSDARAVTTMPFCIAITDHTKNMAVARGAKPENVFVLYNPVDLSRFYPRPVPENDVDVLYAGRFSPEKGVEVLLDALALLPGRLTVFLVGEGASRSALEEKARTSRHAIRFTGWIENRLLPETLCRAKLQIIPSLAEPQGRVVLDAMACGVPVIASRVGGIPEMAQDGVNGWLFPPGDAKALAERIQAALADADARKARAAAGLETAQRFSKENFENKLSEITRHILASHAAQGG